MMATLAQLTAEPWWTREIVTLELDWLGDELCRRTGRPADAFGSKGNVAHLRGSHRSQEWIKNSAYATSRTYTVQSGLTTLQARYIGGADWTPGDWGTAENRRRMVVMSQRIISAMKAGELPEVREYFGTLDGKTVTGWSNVTHAPVSSDDSHLDHGHLGLFRQHANDRALMERLADLITGDDMSFFDEVQYRNRTGEQLITDIWYTNVDPAGLTRSALTEIQANLVAVLGKDYVDEQAIVNGVLAGLAAQSADEIAQRLAELLGPELGAQVVSALGAKLTAPAG
jgi:hypothetical protein